jgi:hypothetical protein
MTKLSVNRKPDPSLTFAANEILPKLEAGGFG